MVPVPGHEVVPVAHDAAWAHQAARPQHDALLILRQLQPVLPQADESLHGVSDDHAPLIVRVQGVGGLMSGEHGLVAGHVITLRSQERTSAAGVVYVALVERVHQEHVC